ncbi:MAG: response regulator [Desulfobulbaceae bacterium]|nr:MAG: response regulator [Desulfobulbaceae bacterium]
MKDVTYSILVVDDQPANLQVLLKFLQENNFQVYVADSGKRTLSVLENLEPDLILLDVMMPEMDGFETCKQIKNVEKWKDIPIIFMTALDDIEDKLTGFDSGGVDYIPKPFKQAEVLARVTTHIKLRRREKELQEALDEIKILRGFLPICANCKSIRDDQGYWNQLETYMSEHSDVKFSHSICPDCVEKLYPEFVNKGKD